MPDMISIDIDGQRVEVPAGSTVAAAIARMSTSAGVVTRRSIDGALRGPVCGMGICQECRVTIDGRAHRLACQTLCASGMQIATALAPS